MKIILFFLFSHSLFAQIGFNAFETVARCDDGEWTHDMGWRECSDVVVVWNTLRIEVLGENGEREVYDVEKDSLARERIVFGNRQWIYPVINAHGTKWKAEIYIFNRTIGEQIGALVLRRGDFSMNYKLSKR